MSLPLVVVDAFADAPFRGNPAAVCLLDRWRSDDWLQAVAAEMNLSETAFLLRRGSDEWDLRWFTPKVEVDLCGHATLAAAYALQRIWNEPAEQLRFHTRSGLLTASVGASAVAIDLPIDAPEPVDAAIVADLFDDVCYVGRTRFDLLVHLHSAEAVRSYQPDLTRLRALDCRGVIITAASDDARFDFVSRFFAPNAGIDEDPVTGSAHCSLSPYWAQRLQRTALTAWQASSRGGRLALEVGAERVHLAGRAYVTVEGWLRI